MDAEVIIVGAGPAGSNAARLLAEEDIDVLLLDKEAFPRFKPCGGGLPTHVLSCYPFLRELDVIESYSYGGYIYPPSLTQKVHIEKESPVIAMVRRDIFDHAFLNLAKKKGARIMEKAMVKDLALNADGVHLTLNNNDSLHAKLVIGADGVFSTIARKAKLSTRPEVLGMCIVGEWYVEEDLMDEYFTDKRFCHLHSGFMNIAGYGWVFAKKCHLNIGLLDHREFHTNAQKVNLKKIFSAYISVLKEKRIIPDEITMSHVHGGVIPIRPQNYTYGTNVLLCGDAAGFVNPVSGEGIYYALASAELAAQTTTEALHHHDTSARFLSRYQQRWKQDFGKEIRLWLRSKGKWGARSENLVRLMNQDQRLAEMLYLVMTGQQRLYDWRWRIILRYILARCTSFRKGQNPHQ
jgi:geranylgeranyl reductase family protein